MTKDQARSKAQTLADEMQRAYQVLWHRHWKNHPPRIEFAGRPYTLAWKFQVIVHPKAPRTTNQQLALALAPVIPVQKLHDLH